MIKRTRKRKEIRLKIQMMSILLVKTEQIKREKMMKLNHINLVKNQV